MKHKKEISLAEMYLYFGAYSIFYEIIRYIRNKQIYPMEFLKIIGIVWIIMSLIYLIFNKGSFKKTSSDNFLPITILTCVISIAVISFIM